MKKPYLILALCFLLLFQFSCEEEGLDPTFLSNPTEDLAFQTNFQSNYLLDLNTITETVETLAWNAISFGGQNVIVNYRVQGSINQDFSTIDYQSGNINSLELPLSASVLYNLGEEAGLDTDPQTTDSSGNPNNSGTVYLRLVSFVGNFNATNVVKKYSDPQGLTIELVELQCEGSELSTWGFVGPFNGWNINNPPVYALLTTNAPNVFRGIVTVDDQGFKISVLDGSFSAGFAYGGAEGVLVEDTGFDPVIPTSPGHFLFIADLDNLSYTMEETTAYGLIGPAAPNAWEGPNHKFVPDECEPGVYIARNVPMVVGEFFVRANDDWTESYALGISGEGSFQVNPGIGATGMPVPEDGNYDIIINFNDFTYELIKLN